MMGLGNNILKFRKSTKLSQEQLAEKLDVTRQTISNWELGQTVPDIIQAKEIANVFNVSLDELLDNDVKNVLVEKINNTQKLATKTIEILKCIIIFIIGYISIVTVSMSIMYNNNKNEYLAKLEQESNVNQEAQEKLKNYFSSLKRKNFYGTLDNHTYEYSVFYNEQNEIKEIFKCLIEGNPYTMDLRLVDSSVENAADFLISDNLTIFKESIISYYENSGGIIQEI